MTKQLYYEDSNITRFEGTIVEIKKIKKQYGLVLDSTYFYPEGGGQPGDIGEINGVKIIDTIKDDKKIVHLTNNPLELGPAKCLIDNLHREHYMVQHTGQHLISAVLKKHLDIDTVSVHLGKSISTIEISSDSINNEELLDLELQCNNLIRDNLPIIYHETDFNGLNKFNIRRESKVEDDIRIVEIENYDMVPCGGIHLKTTGKIGLIKIVNSEKIRGNIRLHFKIGSPAYSDYNIKNKIVRSINSLLSTVDNETVLGVENLLTKIGVLKKEKKQYEKILLDKLVKEIIFSEKVIYTLNNYPKGFCQKLSSELKNRLKHGILILEIDNNLKWYLIDSKNEEINFNDFKKNLLPIISGKGGGKSKIWQGSGDNAKMKEFEEKAKNYLANN